MQEKNSGIGEKERIVEIEVERLREFRGHPFKVKPDDQMNMLMESIKMYGIASSYFPAEIVKSRLLKLDYGHIRYVVGCLETNTTKVKNIRKYLLAALFNAPTTIDGYYQAEVNHNMPEFVPGHRETELNVC